MREFLEPAILITFVVALTGSLIAVVAHFAVSGGPGSRPQAHDEAAGSGSRSI
jgi:hypothetical protein